MKTDLVKFENNSYMLQKFDNSLNPIYEKHKPNSLFHRINLAEASPLGVRSVNVSAAGNLVITSTGDPIVKVVDLRSGDLVFNYRGHERTVRNTFIVEDDNMLFTGSWDGTVHQMSLAGRYVKSFIGPCGRIPMIRVAGDLLMAANYNRDVNPDNFNCINLYRVSTGEFLGQYDGHGPGWGGETICMALHVKDNLLYSGSDDRQCFRRRLDTGEILQSYPGHEGSIRFMSLSPDGNTLYTASSDATIRIYDTRSGAMTGSIADTFSGETVDVKQAGDKLLVCSFDGIARAFDLHTLEETQSFIGHRSDLWSICTTCHDRVLVTGSTDGTAAFWSIETGELIAQYHLLADENYTSFLWTSPPDAHGNSLYYTNNPQKYIKVLRRKKNKETVEVTGKRAEEYLQAHNNPSFLLRILNYEHYKNNVERQLNENGGRTHINRRLRLSGNNQ